MSLGLVSPEACLRLVDAASPLRLHMVLPRGTCVLISCKDTDRIGLGLAFMTSFNSITSKRPRLQVQSHSEVLGVRC